VNNDLVGDGRHDRLAHGRRTLGAPGNVRGGTLGQLDFDALSGPDLPARLIARSAVETHVPLLHTTQGVVAAKMKLAAEHFEQRPARLGPTDNEGALHDDHPKFPSDDEKSRAALTTARLVNGSMPLTG
jgi:hypothetical protein